MTSTEDILKKYSRKLESEIESDPGSETDFSREYISFKEETIPSLSRYEKWAKSLGNILTIKLAEKDRQKIQGFLDTAHLEVTASQALTLAIISMLGVFFSTLLICVAIYLINGKAPMLLGFLGFLSACFIFYYTYTSPQRLANKWKLEASSQMVPAILYIVVYMKHTSNLERAIKFASEHLEGPLALDFKKIFYDVEIGHFSTIKQSLDNYLETWRFYAPEFVESFHLIESSLYEPSEQQRVSILEKALQIILDGVYEKMLKYSREIRSPLTNIYMLGIILPTLGLALLPLASTLLGGVLKWYHVIVIFNILIPFFVFYMVSQVMLKRPGGYGESSVLRLSPDYESFKSKKPWITASIIAIPLLIIGLLPILFQTNIIPSLLNIPQDYTFAKLGITALGNMNVFGIKTINGVTKGPFSPFSAIISMLIPLSIALFFIIAYRGKTTKLIKSRKDTKKLESEFTNSLFQLGNRLGDGIPAEIAFGRVAEATRGQITSSFFSVVNQNIQQTGMSLESAIFDKRRGALTYYPSSLISTSMRILTESVKKGLQIAAHSLMSISEYVKNIEKINQRLRDLLAEIVSDMKSNMTFLAPLLAGIVVGLASMITQILSTLQTLQTQAGGADLGGFASIASITSIFDVTQIVPPYFIEISIGIYIIEIIFILTNALVTVDSGQDILRERYDLSKNLFRGTMLYLGTALLSTIALALLAKIAIGGLLS